MAEPIEQQITIEKVRYYLLSPMPPFADICLQSTKIRPHEFSKVEKLAANYPNDPRLVEMIRKGGDASAKVPYLLDTGETANSILEILREIARPHVDRIEQLPDPIKATIHLLLSLNTVPHGCEKYAIASLLEIDQIQADFVKRLHDLMAHRKLAMDFLSSNIAALNSLDQEWPHLRAEKIPHWQRMKIPEYARMQFLPLFDKADRLISVYETCVIVDPPATHTLQAFIPPILKRPLPADVPALATGSADWLIREVGKIGRHFTRGLIDIIKAHLAAEQVALEVQNYELIARQAQEALREHIANTP